MQDRGHKVPAQQRPVVGIEVVCDEHGRPQPGCLERRERRPVASADGIDGVDPRVLLERCRDRLVHRRIEPVGVGERADHPLRRGLVQGLDEAGDPLLLAVERRAALGDQHVAGRAGPVVDEVRRGRAGRTVVHPGVRRPRAAGHVGDVGDGRDPQTSKAVHGRTHVGMVGCLEHDAVRAAGSDRVEQTHRRGRVAVLAEVGAHADDGGTQRLELLLQRPARRRGEPLRRLHDQVEDHRSGGEQHLLALTVELLDRPLHLGDRRGADADTTVQDAIHGGAAQPGLGHDVADPVRATLRHVGTSWFRTLEEGRR